MQTARASAEQCTTAVTGYRGSPAGPAKETTNMLTTILVLLVVLWLLGMVSSYTLGGFIHILLVLAVAILLIRVIQGRNPVV
jgi:hypothetical protein